MLTMFWILAVVMVVSAFAVATLPNALYGALCLVVNLCAVAGIYAVLGAHFLAAAQIIVYAGAIMVLIVFVLMLLNVKSEKQKFSDFVLFVLGLALVAGLLAVILPVVKQLPSGKGMIGQSIGATPLSGTVHALGVIIFKEHIFLLEVIGVVLVTAIVASVMLANQRKKPEGSK